MKGMTKRGFFALSREVAKLAVDLTEKTKYNWSVMISKDSVTLCANENEKSTCLVYCSFYKGGFCNRSEYKPLSDILILFGEVNIGKYMSIINHSYMNSNKNNRYFEF